MAEKYRDLITSKEKFDCFTHKRMEITPGEWCCEHTITALCHASSYKVARNEDGTCKHQHNFSYSSDNQGEEWALCCPHKMDEECHTGCNEHKFIPNPHRASSAAHLVGDCCGHDKKDSCHKVSREFESTPYNSCVGRTHEAIIYGDTVTCCRHHERASCHGIR